MNDWGEHDVMQRLPSSMIKAGTVHTSMSTGNVLSTASLLVQMDKATSENKSIQASIYIKHLHVCNLTSSQNAALTTP